MKVAVLGSAVESSRQARELGRRLAQAGHVVVTGACGGLPGEAEDAAVAAGGTVLGFSPAANEEEHIALGLPPRRGRPTVWTCKGFKGRNVIMVLASDAVVMIGGRLGTLHEAITGLEEGCPIYVFWATGGAATLFGPLVRLLRPEFLKRMVLCRKVEALVDRLPVL